MKMSQEIYKERMHLAVVVGLTINAINNISGTFMACYHQFSLNIFYCSNNSNGVVLQVLTRLVTAFPLQYSIQQQHGK